MNTFSITNFNIILITMLSDTFKINITRYKTYYIFFVLNPPVVFEV